jgi:hypothetical protein
MPGMSEERRRLNSAFGWGAMAGLSGVALIDATFAEPFRWSTTAIWGLWFVLSWVFAIRLYFKAPP